MRDDSIQRLAAAADDHSDAAVEEHIQQVDACLHQGMESSAVVVLNAGLESLVRESLYDELSGREDVLAEQRMDDIDSNQARYSDMLDEALGLDVIDDDIYDELDALRRERNEYVHADGLDDISIEREDVGADRRADLDDAYNLYAQIIGHEWSDDSDSNGFEKQRNPERGRTERFGGTHRAAA